MIYNKTTGIYGFLTTKSEEHEGRCLFLLGFNKRTPKEKGDYKSYKVLHWRKEQNQHKRALFSSHFPRRG